MQRVAEKSKDTQPNKEDRYFSDLETSYQWMLDLFLERAIEECNLGVKRLQALSHEYVSVITKLTRW